ncbi:hypothetical protein [Nocardia sp. NPDC057440]|uniref:hypothetical protein n=1 Tax=Nocardia sp. NPDC057440 TaxID=3346134 RepID=UPI00366DEB02
MIRSRRRMPTVSDDVWGAAVPRDYRRTVMDIGVETARPWRRTRNLLIAVGDVVGVLVLSGAVYVLGSQGGALDALLTFRAK